MKPILFSFIIALYLITPFSISLADDSHDESHICFYKMDKDRDGALTPKELSAVYPDQKNLFKEIDQDNDTAISHDEYEEYWASKE